MFVAKPGDPPRPTDFVAPELFDKPPGARSGSPVGAGGGGVAIGPTGPEGTPPDAAGAATGSSMGINSVRLTGPVLGEKVVTATGGITAAEAIRPPNPGEPGPGEPKPAVGNVDPPIAGVPKGGLLKLPGTLFLSGRAKPEDGGGENSEEPFPLDAVDPDLRLSLEDSRAGIPEGAGGAVPKIPVLEPDTAPRPAEGGSGGNPLERSGPLLSVFSSDLSFFGSEVTAPGLSFELSAVAGLAMFPEEFISPGSGGIPPGKPSLTGEAAGEAEIPKFQIWIFHPTREETRAFHPTWQHSPSWALVVPFPFREAEANHREVCLLRA